MSMTNNQCQPQWRRAEISPRSSRSATATRMIRSPQWRRAEISPRSSIGPQARLPAPGRNGGGLRSALGDADGRP